MQTNVLQAIQSVAPAAAVDINAIADTINEYGDSYGVNTVSRLKAFIAQAAHETAGFKTLKEYASGSAYEGRADLGNTQPGDGVKYKGRGIFQITGRGNYADTSRVLFGDNRLIDNPAILEQPKYATLSALYFWKSRNLNSLADAGDFEGITRRINGGLNGWADRLNYYQRLEIAFMNKPAASRVAIVAGGLMFIGLSGYFIYRFIRKNN